VVYDSIAWTWKEDNFMTETDWSYAGQDTLISDLTGDGIVNILDLAILANDWLAGSKL
jgi:hypothetical protein